MVPAQGVERWLTQRLSHRLGVGARGGDGVCAGVRFLSPARWSRCCSTASATTRGTPTGWSGRCSRSSTPASTSRGARPWPPTSATGSTATRASCAATAATPSPGGWPACSPRTPCSGRSSSPTGARAATPTAPAARSTTTCCGRPSCGAGCSTGSASRRPTCGTPRRSTRLRAGGDGLDLPGRLSLFGHTRLPVTEVALLEALAERRDVHLWLPQPSPQLWDDLAGIGGRGAARGRRLGRRGRHPLLASLGRDAASCGACSDAVTDGDARASVEPAEPPDAAGLAAGRPPRQPRPDGRRARRPPARRRRPQPSRSTPATARPARSTCCARCWSGCSRTTPLSSRATSS